MADGAGSEAPLLHPGVVGGSLISREPFRLGWWQDGRPVSGGLARCPFRDKLDDRGDACKGLPQRWVGVRGGGVGAGSFPG
jgi:hypothetical protein